ncbi:Cysteine protease atg4 [Tulasnella sp. 419]|nr:Cysteine protease atg4 [Tulasnella sp. 419]
MNPNTSNTHSHKINKLFSRTSNRSSSSSAASSDHRTTSASKSTWPPSGRRPSSTQEETPEEVAVASSSTDEVNGASGDGVFESPVIVEPPTPQMSALRIGTGAGSTRRHTHTYYDRPYSVVDLPPSSYNSPTAATPRLADFPSRLSGWFSNLAGSSTDLSQLMHQSGQSIPPPTPTALAQNSMSPKHKASGIFTSAARHGKGGLEKAVRYLLDSDAQPDKCTDPIWLMGVCHPGYDPSQQVITPASLPVGTGGGHRRDSTESSFFGRRSSPPTISKGTFHQNPSLQSLSLSLANTPSSSSSGQGISGGRPSSSYYFVGEQAGSLFYLDPHHTRVAVPLRSPPTPTSPAMTANSQLESDDVEKEKPREKSIHKLSPSKPKHAMTDRDSLDSFSTSPPKRHESIKLLKHRRVPTSPQRHHQTLHNPRSSGSSTHSNNAPLPPPQLTFSLPPSPPPPNVEPWVYHYATAYSPSELRTFHCDKVRKMPFSALDPSMLLGFLCKDESDWKDLRIRVAELARVSKTIFTIQDEPPSWSSDPDDLESVSDPDIDLEDEDDESVEVDRYDKHEPDEDEEEDVDKVSDDFYDAEEGNASDGRKRHAAKHQELHHSREGVGEPTTTSRASSLFTGIDDDAKEQKPHVAGDHTDLSAYGEEDDDGTGSESDWVVDSSSAWGPSPSSAPAAVSVPAPPPVTEQPAAAASVSPPLSRSSTLASAASSSSTHNSQSALPFPKVSGSPRGSSEYDRSSPIEEVGGGKKGMGGFSGLRSMKARNGGRTKSGGIKAIFTMDDENGIARDV